MATVRELTPDDVLAANQKPPASGGVIVAADRRGERFGETLMEAVVEQSELGGVTLWLQCRRGLILYYESVGFELFDPEIPEGDTEKLVRMVYSHEDC